MDKALTPRQQQILDFIRSAQNERGMPPTRDEIMRAFGFRSPNAAECHLRALQKKGVLRLTSGVSRGIQLTQPGGVPLIGRVAAGHPILAVEHIEDHFHIDARLFKPAPDYLLRVQGDSMINAGIHDGDLLAVHRTQVAEPGQIVVARLDDEVTVKRLHRQGQRLQLLAENPAYPPIDLDPDKTSLCIEGISVGVIRPQPQ